MGESQQANNDAKKDVRLMRKSAHLERMGALEENIDSMEDQRDKMKSASVFNFVIGMVSNFVNMAVQAFSFAFPAAAPFLQLGNQTIQGFLQGLSALKNPEAAMMDSQIDQQKFQEMAEEAQYQYDMADETYKSYDESGDLINQRLEASLQNIMKAQEASARPY